MSVHAMTWVLEHSAHKGGELLVLLLIANHAGSDGWECWPSVGLLARESRLTERQVRRIIRALEASGEIMSDVRGGPHGANLYRVVGQERLMDLAPTSPGKNVPSDMGDREGGTPVTGDPGHPLPPNRNRTVSEPSDTRDRFEEAWKAYPAEGRRAKPTARRRWAVAIRKADPDAIIAAIVGYANDPNRDPEHTKWIQGWLSEERWNDPPLPVRLPRGIQPAAPRVDPLAFEQGLAAFVEGGNR